MSAHLWVVPLELAEANALVRRLHRHHKPAQGHRFSLGVIDDDGTLHGAAIIGRPVARMAGSPRDVLEVVRLVTDGTPNACSALYAAAARAGHAMGFRRIQTYILDSEPGTSLRASGWRSEGGAGGGQWKHTDGRPRRTDQPTGPKERWTRALLVGRPDLTVPPERLDDPSQIDLFGTQESRSEISLSTASSPSRAMAAHPSASVASGYNTELIASTPSESASLSSIPQKLAEPDDIGGAA